VRTHYYTGPPIGPEKASQEWPNFPFPVNRKVAQGVEVEASWPDFRVVGHDRIDALDKTGYPESSPEPMQQAA
jgi:hypothetical protein